MEGIVAGKRGTRGKDAARREQLPRRGVEQARRARAAKRRRTASFRPPQPPRRELWTDGRRFWVEGLYGTEQGISVAQARELMASGDYVLKRLSRRTNLPLERRVGDLAEPTRRRPRYSPQAAPVPRGGGYKHGI